MALNKVSDEELTAELDRRKQERNKPPSRLKEPNFQALIHCIEDGVAQMSIERYQDEEFSHYVYEEAMTAVYGKTYWDWRNQVDW